MTGKVRPRHIRLNEKGSVKRLEEQMEYISKQTKVIIGLLKRILVFLIE